MPLASSRTSVEKREAALAEERIREERRRRLSFPSTIRSSTRVTRSHAKRRLSKQFDDPSKGKKQKPAKPSEIPSSKGTPKKTIARTSREDKENNNDEESEVQMMSPTPYWKVAKERGNKFSPPATRSGKKKAMASEGGEFKGMGLVLSFSPPDQEKNARREAEEFERKQRERCRKVAQARQSGRLLVFSPNGTCTNYTEKTNPEQPKSEQKEESKQIETTPQRLAADPPADPPQLKEQISSVVAEEIALPPKVPKTSNTTTEPETLPSEKENAIAAELKSLREAMDSLVASKNSIESSGAAQVNEAERIALQAHQLRNKTLEAENRKLETKGDKLQSRLEELSDKFSTEKEKFLVETTRLQEQLAASEQDSLTRMQGIQSTCDKLESQVSTLQMERESMREKVAHLEEQLTSAREMLSASENKTGSLEKIVEQNQILRDNAKDLEMARSALAKELEAVKSAKEKLELHAAECERKIDNFKNNLLPTAEKQLKNALEQLDSEKSLTKESHDILEKRDAMINTLKKEIETLMQEAQANTNHFKQLNMSAEGAMKDLQRNGQEKDEKIGELRTKLEDIQSQYQSQKEKAEEAVLLTEKIKNEMKSRIMDLETALGASKIEITKSEKAREHLNEELTQLKVQVQATTSEKADALMQASKHSEKVSALRESLANENQSRQQLEEYKTTLEEERRQKHMRILELEEKLRVTEKDRDAALSRLGTVDKRENELLRKLLEGDRIRRGLHSRVMQLSGNIRVFVRVRPALAGEEELASKEEVPKRRKVSASSPAVKKRTENPFRFPGDYDRHESKGVHAQGADDLTKKLIEVTEPFKDRGGLRERRKKWTFGFDHVFSPSSGQEDIWEATEPLVQSAIDGYNVTIFAYGQTGSGKTYTMLGDAENKGLIARAVDRIFAAKQDLEVLSCGTSKVRISIELLEIYNEKVRDLLASEAGSDGAELDLKVTSNEVVGNTVVLADCETEVMDVLEIAQSRRCVKATLSNSESSRSHMIFTINFDVETKDGMHLSGKLNVCDLAGSERLGKSGANTHVTGDLMKETKSINSSLSVLSNVIESLQNGNSSIPYRESKLTFLLQNSLGGNSKTLAIVCCNPLGSHFHESLCSLRFAAKVNKVDLKALANFKA